MVNYREEKESNMYTKYVGYDANAIPRVLGVGKNRLIAEASCIEEARNYIKSRPEAGPFTHWRFMKVPYVPNYRRRKIGKNIRNQPVY